MLLALAIACASSTAEIRLLDEAGSPTRGWVELDGVRTSSDAHGRVRLALPAQPVLLLAGGDGHLTEPVPMGPEERDAPIEVRLWDEDRVSLHFGGDLMLGRRYLDPGEDKVPLIPAEGREEGTRAVLSDLSRLFGLADLSVANSESVIVETAWTEPVLDAALVNTPDDELPYPGKRWVLQTPPEVAATAIEALGLDVLAMGNNHQYDWEELGLASGLVALGCDDPDGALEDPCVGAGMSAEEAALPSLQVVSGMTVGTLAMTSVDGNWVNDNYPTEPGEPPAEPELAWVAEARTWGEPELGVPVAERIPGQAWQAITAVEEDLSEVERAALWASARAAYPGLQDWVARRGHGGASHFSEADDAELTRSVRALRPEVDLLVVQLHMGFQFAEQPGAAVRQAARAAVDAGADLVICHHPHVLQGVEWYRGRLIAYSLGNLVFDQDFLSTFPSVMLRTIFDTEGQLLEARLVPLWLDGYRPVPSVGDRAKASLSAIWESSLLAATSERGADGVVRSVPDLAPTGWPALVWEHNTARIELQEGALTTRPLVLAMSGLATPIPGRGLVMAGEGAPAGLELGRALLRLGSFDDLDTDAEVDELDGWSTGGSSDLSVSPFGHGTGNALELARAPSDGSALYARAVARVTLPAHRLWSSADGEAGLDGDARYSVRTWAWLEGEPGRARLRLDLYHFDDLDPTAEPTSERLRSVTLPLEVTVGGWQELLIDLDPAALEPVDGLTPNAALLYVYLDPPERTGTVLRLDDLELIEWRPAEEGPSRVTRADYARGDAVSANLSIVAW